MDLFNSTILLSSSEFLWESLFISVNSPWSPFLNSSKSLCKLLTYLTLYSNSSFIFWLSPLSFRISNSYWSSLILKLLVKVEDFLSAYSLSWRVCASNCCFWASRPSFLPFYSLKRCSNLFMFYVQVESCSSRLLILLLSYEFFFLYSSISSLSLPVLSVSSLYRIFRVSSSSLSVSIYCL